MKEFGLTCIAVALVIIAGVLATHQSLLWIPFLVSGCWIAWHIAWKTN